MSIFSFWHVRTGEIHPQHVLTSEREQLDEFLVLNTPADHRPIAQALDPKRHRVNPQTGEVEALQGQEFR